MKDFSKKNSLELISNGKAFIERTATCISKSQHFIFIHTYIFKFDEITGSIVSELIAASKRGVKIYVLVDGFGSKHISEKEINLLEKNQINFNFFKLFSNFSHIGRRLHQKLVLIDNQIAIIGGINLAKEYNLPQDSKPWLDYACILKGEEIYNIFQSILPLYKKSFPQEKEELDSFSKLRPQDVNRTCLVKTNINDWMRYKNEIYTSYIKAINDSKQSVYLLATYFIPGKKLLKELKKAKQRGVEINLVFGHKSDHTIIQRVEYYFYKWYLLNDFSIYEWSDSIIHGKIALIDNRWVTIGSYNHNYISRFGNLELNLEVINKDFASSIQDEFSRMIKHSKKLERSEYESRFNILDKFYILSSYFFLNMITLVSIFFIFRRSRTRVSLSKET